MLLLLESGIKCSFFLGIFLFLMKCTAGDADEANLEAVVEAQRTTEGVQCYMGRVSTGWRAHVLATFMRLCLCVRVCMCVGAILREDWWNVSE